MFDSSFPSSSSRCTKLTASIVQRLGFTSEVLRQEAPSYHLSNRSSEWKGPLRKSDCQAITRWNLLSCNLPIVQHEDISFFIFDTLNWFLSLIQEENQNPWKRLIFQPPGCIMSKQESIKRKRPKTTTVSVDLSRSQCRSQQSQVSDGPCFGEGMMPGSCQSCNGSWTCQIDLYRSLGCSWT